MLQRSMAAQSAHDRQRLRALAGLVLRDLRIEAGHTQVEVAARLGRAQSYVSKYESGELRVDVIALREICRVIGVRVADFFERVEEGDRGAVGPQGPQAQSRGEMTLAPTRPSVVQVVREH